MLSSFGSPKHNKNMVYKELISEFGVKSSDAINMIKLIMWAHETGYLKACRSFISMHNKGVIETDTEILDMYPDIIKYTFIGDLFKEFYEINETINRVAEEVSSGESEVDLDDYVLNLF